MKLPASAWTRRVLIWAVVVVLGLGLLVGRVLWSSKAELDQGKAAFQSGDRQAAVLHLKRSAHWYTPGNPSVTEALEELRQIGRQAEMEGQTDLALAAYRAIRTSCLGTRSLYTPHPERLDEANQRIAALLARQPPPPMSRSKTATQRREEHMALLERVEQPQPLWALLACLSFLAWVIGALGFILRGLDDELHIKRQAAWRWATVFVFGIALWATALLLA